jgi:hypothetical protein
MDQGFGNEVPGQHTRTPHRKGTRELVVIDSGGYAVARLFLESREQVAEFDANTEEVTQMTNGLSPMTGADGPEWDNALTGHSASERSTASIYTLDV